MMTNDQRDEAITEIRVSVATIAANCPGCRSTLAEHHVALDGNGSKGIKTRLSNLELNVKWLWGVVGAVSTGGGMVLLKKLFGV